jgi:uncharacterized protein (DUF58 family)
MNRLFARRRTMRPKTSTVDATDARFNPATCVTLKELIDLQRYARNLDLAYRQPVRAQLAGNHDSRFRGRGMDYQESRSYQPGDDIRNMDWRVTARAGRPHTKLFQDERERPVVLFLDLGPSLFFATQGVLKSVVSARAATLLAWAAAAHGDRIGALLFNGGHHELKPRSGHRGVLPLIHSLVEHTDPVRGLSTAPHPGGLNDALVRLRRIVRPGSLVFLIGDFNGLDENTSNHLLRLRQHNDLAALHITDPLELASPLPGRYGVTDGEHVGILDTRSETGRQHYNTFFQQHQKRLQQVMQQCAIPLLPLSTTDNVVSALQARFGNRVTATAPRSAIA